MYTALTLEKRLGGLLVLSSWLPLHKSFPQAMKWHSGTPVLQCHGTVQYYRCFELFIGNSSFIICF
jgi:predicted esterase